jgi:NAD(P)-dependent dehydrogenase (short-subunit alcohol dehydrogenase family)
MCDMGNRAEIERMMRAAAATLGGLDVLVNNAGIAGPTTPVEQFDAAEWDKVVKVNLTGTFDVTRLAIPHLRQSSAGVIINMSSVAGRFGYANRSAYCATKWAIIGFTKTLAIELGEAGIRANAILPGAVAGPRIERVFEGRAQATGQSLEQVKASAMEHQSIKRLVDPRDIAALAVFLASDSAKSISGQMLPIDNDMQQAS